MGDLLGERGWGIRGSSWGARFVGGRRFVEDQRRRPRAYWLARCVRDQNVRGEAGEGVVHVHPLLEISPVAECIEQNLAEKGRHIIT